MKLHLTQSNGSNLITAYGDDYIDINHKRHHNSLILMAEQLISDWKTAPQKVATINHLTEQVFEQVIALKPEVVLLGTGKTHQFLHPKNYASLTQQGITLECMTTAAACRTYNILMSEGRNVAAMLII